MMNKKNLNRVSKLKVIIAYTFKYAYRYTILLSLWHVYNTILISN